MGFDLGVLSLRLEADTTAFDAALQQVEKSAKRTSQQMTDTGGRADDAGKRIGGVAERATSAARGLDTAGRATQKLGEESVTTAKGVELVAKSAQKASGEITSVGSSAGKAAEGTARLGDEMARTGAKAEVSASKVSTWQKYLGVAALGAATKQVISLGNEFTDSMNTLAAVSQATGVELAGAAQRARELGNDVTLPATSASDAALAMSELAKGGFSVEQAMTAAKGTLQLAAAAQTDAATAATIQSQALQAFSLDANDAARVSDILAGAANASSADIAGVADALKQSGTVAHGFGVSIDDTATAIAMFANAGITGSDAGTLLKTSLLAVTNQSKAAQSAQEELGVSLYQDGKFVGLSSMFEQLSQAQKNMSDEAYQAATNQLFGSDAIRQAMVAAQQGGAGFEALEEKITRQGQAAEVAEAKTRGLPGAIAAVGNSVEAVSMQAYDAFSDDLTRLMHGLASGIDAVGESAASLPVGAWAAGFALLAGNASGLFERVNTGGSKFATLAREMGTARSSALAQGEAMGRVNAAMQVLGAHSPVIDRVNSAYARGAAPLGALAMKHREAAAAAQVQAMASRDLFTTVDRMGAQAASSFTAGVTRIGSAASGAALGGLSLMKTGVSGIVGALGGPWGLAITGAVAVIGQLTAEHQKAKAAEEEHKQAVDQLSDSLDRQTGSITEVTRAQVIDRAEKSGLLIKSAVAGVDSSTLTDAMLGEADALTVIKARVDDVTAAFFASDPAIKTFKKTFDDMGVTSDTLISALVGNAEAISKLGTSTEATLGLQVMKNALTENQLALLEVGEAAKASAGDVDSARDAALRKAAADDRMGRIAQVTTESMKLLGDSVTGIVGEKSISVKADAITDETRQRLEDLHVKVNEPFNGEVTLDFQDGFYVNEVLDKLGLKIERLPDGHFTIDPTSVENMQALMGDVDNWLRTDKQGRLIIKSELPEVQQKLLELQILAGKPRQGTVHINHNFDPVLRKSQELQRLNGTTTKQSHVVEEVHIRRNATVQGTASRGGEMIPALAGGGRLPTTGRGTETVDGFLGVDTSGVPLAWLNAGEQVVNRESTERYSTALHVMNDRNSTGAQVLAALMNDLPGLVDGGVAGTVKSALSGVGNRYIFGGFGTAGTDCSGAVSMAVNAAEGDDILAARATTHNMAQFLEARGFVRGRGGAGSVQVGFLNGGAGGGHTAIQLDDGSYIESGGNTGQGLTIGGKAGPLDGRGFTDFYHKYYAGDTESSVSESTTVSTPGFSAFSAGGSGGGFTPVSTSQSAAGARMGVTGSLGGVVSTAGSGASGAAQGFLRSATAELQRLGVAGVDLTRVLDAHVGKMGEFLFVTDKTIQSFNELGQARQEEADAAREIAEATERIAELKKNASKSDRDSAERLQDAQKALEKARKSEAKNAEAEAEKRDRVAKAERAVRDTEEGISDKARQTAKQAEDAEKTLTKAREKQVHATVRVADAEKAHMIQLFSAPAEQVLSVLQFVPDVLDLVGHGIGVSLAAEKRRLEQVENSVQVWERAVSAQDALATAMDTASKATLDHVSTRWRSDLAISDAEWALTLHRKRAARELAQAGLFGIDVERKRAEVARHGAVLDAQISFERARAKLDEFERDQAVASANADLAYQQQQSGLAASRLALVSAVLVDIQEKLSDTTARELEAKQAALEASSAKFRGGLGIAGGIVGILGAVAMGLTGNIPAAIAMGAASIGAVAKGAGDVSTGVAKSAESQARNEVLTGGGKAAAGGAHRGTLEGLESQQRLLEIQHREAMSERKKQAVATREVLARIADGSERALEVAKREESRANDLLALDSDSRAQAQVFMQVGGSSWAGQFGGVYAPSFTGFGGVRDGRLSGVGSLEVEGVDRARSSVGRVPAPEVRGAAAALVAARATVDTRNAMLELVEVAREIKRSLPTDRATNRASVGTVINGNVQVDSGTSRNLIAALAR